MALFAFNIVTVRETGDGRVSNLIVDHPGGMVEAASDYEALGKATRIADKLTPLNGLKFRHVSVWPATQVVDPEDPTIKLIPGHDQ